MPVIEPTSPEDCVRFVTDNRADIGAGIYDVRIHPGWIQKLPKEVLNLLLAHCNTSKAVIARSIQAKGAGEKLLERLGGDDDASVRVAVASNRHTPVSVLTTLAGDYFAEVRIAVAKNPAIPPDLFTELSQDKSTHIRLAVASNPSLTLEIANRLSRDRSDNVRNAILEIARDEATDPNYLNTLSKCQSHLVRQAICENPRVPEALLEILARDEHADVRQTVLRQWTAQARRSRATPKELDKLAAKPFEEVRMAVAANPNTPAATVEGIVRQGGARLKESIARSETVAAELLALLAGDDNADVRALVARNSRCPDAALEHLQQDANPKVTGALAENPKVAEQRKRDGLCLGCGGKLGKLRSLIGDLCSACS